MNATKRACPICGDELPASKPRITYCSPQCWGKARRGVPTPRHKEPTYNTCPTCGEGFATGRAAGKPRNAVYCSRECAGEAQRKYYTCKQCGVAFRSKRRAGNPQFCSQQCYGQSRIGMGVVEMTCSECGNAFKAPRQNSSPRHFCSLRCRHKHATGYLRGPAHPHWKGGTFISHGYVYEQDLRRPPKSSGKPHYRRQHVRVMEEKIGRPLERGDHVHHIDGDPLNNDPSNLMLLTAGVHTALHHHFAQEYMRIHREAGDLAAITLAFVAERASAA